MCVVIHIPILTAVEHRFLLLAKTHSSKTASCSTTFCLQNWGRLVTGFSYNFGLWCLCLFVFIFVPSGSICPRCAMPQMCDLKPHVTGICIYYVLENEGIYLSLHISAAKLSYYYFHIFSAVFTDALLCVCGIGLVFFFFVLDFFHVIMTDLVR